MKKNIIMRNKAIGLFIIAIANISMCIYFFITVNNTYTVIIFYCIFITLPIMILRMAFIYFYRFVDRVEGTQYSATLYKNGESIKKNAQLYCIKKYKEDSFVEKGYIEYVTFFIDRKKWGCLKEDFLLKEDADNSQKTDNNT